MATWYMKGDTIGACSCDYGCPCTFDAPPTQGWCQGGWILHVNEGRVNDVALDGLTLGLFARSPAAIHLGNLTLFLLADEKATPSQRQALEPLLRGEYGGVPGIFAGLATKRFGPEFVAADWKPNGLNGYARLGSVVEIQLTPIKNPVTGVESPFTVLLGNGLATDRMELATTTTFRFNHPELSYQHPDKFGETFKFHWSGSV